LWSYHTQEEQVTEGTLPTDPTGAGQDSTQSVESQPKSVEEVEAFWRNRFSARDKAHNAETAALKAQIEAMQKAPSKPQEGESPDAARLRELEQALEQERARARAAELRTQYPLAASILGDEVVRVSPEKLAAFNAAVEQGESPIIDPNSAPRRGAMAAPKPPAEKSIDELKGELKALTPAYQQMMREK
jgi:hypothetical protein